MKNYTLLKESGLEPNIIESIAKQANHNASNLEGIEDGDLIPVMVNGEIYVNPFKHDYTMAPTCEPQKCESVRKELNQICKDNNWPAGHYVLVCSVDGECCNCECL
ncbi:hypothetical protein JMN32_19310 [Fulvivirga sp. 29W222]|uniref:Uncharacterized protein n=1 Tax=Fulvivirga marina TaxID=2494733 RepID=A0A937G1V9_9BACT|nr:hypothetical protein [Fulvivirga marina]MBL6448470.1 hypothetical protein [Fulvivirga marina]